jgi:electron transfer flavoprotein alpha subunit
VIDPAYLASEASGIWVFLEHDEGQVAGVSLELLGKARELAAQSGSKLTGLLMGGNLGELPAQAALLDLDEVVVVSHPLLEQFTAEAYAHAAEQVIRERKPDILLLGATAYGRDIAGRLAVMLRTGLTADCTDLELEPGTTLLLGEVSGFGGGILASIKCEVHRPQMATVRPGVFAETNIAREAPAAIATVPVDVPASAKPVEVIARHRQQGVDISKAERLVVAGRGIAGDWALVEALAKALDAEIGATRVAVDEGWTGRDRQVGQTGIITRPKLALVCGASGATQFTVGIEEAGLVVAINQDPEAPIFEQADLCVVDDLFPVARALLAQFQAHDGGAS